jgi:DNA-binding ferritin-like protein
MEPEGQSRAERLQAEKRNPEKKEPAMRDLIIILESVRQTCKDWHYNAKGLSFYSNHLLADRIGEPCAAFIDSLKEVCFLGNEKDAPSSVEINAALLDHLPANMAEETLIPEIQTLLTIGMYTIEEAIKQELKQGELNLLGSIAEHLQQSKGLLYRVLKSEQTAK